MQASPPSLEPANQSPPQQGPATRTDAGFAQIAVTTLLVILAFSAGWFGNGFVNRNNYISPDDTNQYIINQAWREINDNYVFTQNIDKQKMAYAAINAMVQTLNDPGHTRFDTPEQYQAENSQENNQSSIGIGVVLSGGGKDPITVAEVFPDSPAAKGGLRPGDQIVGVDGKDVRDMTIDQARPLIRGSAQAGTQVTLTLVRPSAGPAPFSVTLTRGEIQEPTTVSFMIPDLNLAYIQLVNFSQNADDKIREALQTAQSQHAAGIILDLRGNGGGYLQSAVDVSSEFIAAGPGKNVLITRTRSSSQTFPVRSDPKGLATATPLVVLVDGDTASAAEITAGAIAIIRPDVHVVGERTYGTGTVLLPYPLADGSVLVLGTQEWLLPNGQSIYHHGYTPDQVVALPQNVAALSGLSSPNPQPTYADIQKSGDTQMLKAIQDLVPQAGVKPAA
jgi:carboxyl-terminal processing protease